MYQCYECGKEYKMSKENEQMLPTEHIIKCPYCGCTDHVIGAEVDYDEEGKKLFNMYGRKAYLEYNIEDTFLNIITGKKA